MAASSYFGLKLVPTCIGAEHRRFGLKPCMQGQTLTSMSKEITNKTIQSISEGSCADAH